jgi:PhzF family phenazine biosynthesis protein
MQVTAEFALSNTAFVSRRGSSAADGFALRWFTPGGAEVTLCGHATLAAAHALWASGAADAASGALLRFHTRGGLVQCAAQQTAPPGSAAIALDFPAAPAVEAGLGAPAAVLPALGPGAPLPIWVGRSEALNDAVIVLESPEAVRDLAPDLAALAALRGRGVIVTAAARGAAWTGGADYVTRWFAPAVGIPEDAVTGSAHCCLGPFWAARLRKSDLLALQCSPRGGRAAVRVDPAGGRVALLGDCVTVFRGEILAQPSTMMVP